MVTQLKMVKMLQHVWHKKKKLTKHCHRYQPTEFMLPSSLALNHHTQHMQPYICTLSMLVKRLNFSIVIPSFPDYIKPVHFLSPWTWACQGGLNFLVTFGDSGRNNKYRERRMKGLKDGWLQLGETLRWEPLEDWSLVSSLTFRS